MLMTRFVSCPLLLACASASAFACAGPRQPAPVPATVTEERLIELNGVRHWVRVAGRSEATPEPVVFVHGGPGQGAIHFAELVGPELEDELRVVYYDQRASGRSERSPDGAYSLPLLVGDLEALRESLGAERIALIGQSFGGTLALEYAAAYPQRVSAIVFVAGLWDVALQCRLRNRTLAERAPAAYEQVRDADLAGTNRCLEFEAFRDADEGEAYRNAIMYPDSAVRLRIEEVEREHGYRNSGELGRALFRAGLGSYGFEAFDRLSMPVLVIAGGRDGTARSEGLLELSERLPNATFMEYQDSGHFLYVDEPERFARDVIRFLRRAEP